MKEFIPFLKPNLVKSDSYLHLLQEIDESHLYSNYGPLNSRFEERILEEYFDGVGATVTVNNATSGLMLAVAQTKRSGTYAIMPSFTFAATPLAAMWCGLTPYFLDVDPDTWVMDEEQLNYAIEQLGDEVAVVLPYATFGTYLDLTCYERLQDNGIPVVVDAAASFGCTLDDVHFGKNFPGTTVFSFHATKSFGIGEGGLVYSGNHQTIKEIRQAGNFGFNSGREATILGLNSKMSEYSAAIGLATLDVYASKKQTREDTYQQYIDALENQDAFNAGWKTQVFFGNVPHQFFPILCPPDLQNNCLISRLAEANIQARAYFSPACHQQSYFQALPRVDLTTTDQLTTGILSLPLSEEMTEADTHYVIQALL